MRHWFALVFLCLTAGCLFDKESEVVRLSGETMGTTYNIIAIGDNLDSETLSQSIKQTLAAVNAKMSNWDPNSEVSTFSTSNSTAPVKVSAEFARVMAAANEVHEQSGGKFDVTLGPLIELWGFGPRKPDDPVPSDQAILAALEHVGQGSLLHLDESTLMLAKTDGSVGINLSAIAKGFGIDAVAATLDAADVHDYMVEIGGDLVARGENDKGKPWQIGIEKPEPGAQAVQLVVPVSDLGLATSGDYRNFFEQDGVRYSHIIDPTTGRPITHHTTSVTVVSENAMMADAWATAMLALGLDDGMIVAEKFDLAVFFIARDVTGDDEAYITVQSSAFKEVLGRN